MTPIARRALIIAYGAALLIWLGVEDPNSVPPALLGAVGAVLGLMHLPRTDRLALWLMRGAAGGMIAALCAALLMLVKTGWHAHLIPDYPLPMIVGMLARAPLWSAAGALISLGGWMILPRGAPAGASTNGC